MQLSTEVGACGAVTQVDLNLLDLQPGPQHIDRHTHFHPPTGCQRAGQLKCSPGETTLARKRGLRGPAGQLGNPPPRGVHDQTQAAWRATISGELSRQHRDRQVCLTLHHWRDQWCAVRGGLGKVRIEQQQASCFGPIVALLDHAQPVNRRLHCRSFAPVPGMRDHDRPGTRCILRRTVAAAVVADDHDLNTWQVPCCGDGCGDPLLLVLSRDDARDSGQVGAHPAKASLATRPARRVPTIGNLLVMSVEAVTAPGVRSEVGRLRTVLLHRPGNELKRLTPRNNDALLFDGLPWVDRAQQEHDGFAETLRSRGVEVLYVSKLLVETLADSTAHTKAIQDLVSDIRLGETLRNYLLGYLADLGPEELAEIMMAGLRNDEVQDTGSLVAALYRGDHFLIDPLPNLLFTRDSSVWIGDRVTITSLAMPARRRETQLTDLIYTFHPRFAGVERIHGWREEYLEGGDVLAVADGVLAIGVGQRTQPSGAERLARTTFRLGLAHTVLVVPINQDRATMHLDTICTMVDVDAVVMYPNVAHQLSAITVRSGNGSDPLIDQPAPFLEAAARAMGIDQLQLIDTGLDPVTAEREQWDDGNNTLAIEPNVAVAYERNVETNQRLIEAGIEVIPIAGSELGSGRGGPRCMSCPITRDSVSFAL
jgi:arginine deiminase